MKIKNPSYEMADGKYYTLITKHYGKSTEINLIVIKIVVILKVSEQMQL